MMAKNKFKKWWKKHWDEFMLVSGILIAIFILLKANGVF